MPALNFNILVDKVESGEKRQTIRRKRKRPIKKGDKLYLYTRMMHKDCQKLGEAVCTHIKTIFILNDPKEIKVFTTEYRLTSIEIDVLARKDGFESIDKFLSFFIRNYKIKEGLYKVFDVIYWHKLIKQKEG